VYSKAARQRPGRRAPRTPGGRSRMTWAEFSGPFRHAQGAKGVSYWGGESATPLARLEVALRNFSGWIRSAALLGGDLAACHAGRPNQGLTGAQSSLLGGAWRSDAARLS